MSIANGQDANASVFNASFMSRTVDSPITTNIIMPVNKFIYLGSETVDGSWRIGIDSGNMIMEKRESGSWITKSSVEA